MAKSVTKMHEQTHEFASEILGLPIPKTPQLLPDTRRQWAIKALEEELEEFVQATTIEDQADALLDLTYFALGRLVEMGLPPGPMFDAVHNANMKKRRGELSKRPGSCGYDAIKPAGWTAPDLSPWCSTVKKPKLLILGYARHGKDTAAEFLKNRLGLSWASSSEFCAEHIIWPLVADQKAAENFLEGIKNSFNRAFIASALFRMRDQCSNYMECFEIRGEFREVWFQGISAYNAEDKTRLARGLFSQHDMYVGLRNKEEFLAIREAGLVDHVIWVDASKRAPLESAASCQVAPWMADFLVCNNYTIERLHNELEAVIAQICPVSNSMAAAE